MEYNYEYWGPFDNQRGLFKDVGGGHSTSVHFGLSRLNGPASNYSGCWQVAVRYTDFEFFVTVNMAPFVRFDMLLVQVTSSVLRFESSLLSHLERVGRPTELKCTYMRIKIVSPRCLGHLFSGAFNPFLVFWLQGILSSKSGWVGYLDLQKVTFLWPWWMFGGK